MRDPTARLVPAAFNKPSQRIHLYPKLYSRISLAFVPRLVCTAGGYCLQNAFAHRLCPSFHPCSCPKSSIEPRNVQRRPEIQIIVQQLLDEASHLHWKVQQKGRQLPFSGLVNVCLGLKAHSRVRQENRRRTSTDECTKSTQAFSKHTLKPLSRLDTSS